MAVDEIARFGGAQLGRNPVDLSRACMPLVRLLRKEGLSWSDREEIAWAIQDNLRIYGDMEAERQHIAGAAGGIAGMARSDFSMRQGT